MDAFWIFVGVAAGLLLAAGRVAYILDYYKPRRTKHQPRHNHHPRHKRSKR